MGLNVQFAPVEDAGTGEVSTSLDPITHDADDVTNTPVADAVDLPETTTHVADAVKVESTGEHETPKSVTTVGDWPRGEDKAIADSPAATTKAAPAAKKAPAKKRGS